MSEKYVGFIKPVITPDHYVLGSSSLPKVILQPDRNWSPYLPTFESQDITFETYGCTDFGTQNCIEILIKKITGTERNFSDRFIYILSEIRPPGSDPQIPAEQVRSHGEIDETDLPMTDTYDQFIQPDPMDASLLAKGQQWLQKYEFGHEWLWSGDIPLSDKQKLITEALQYSPIGVSLYAWLQDQNGLYYRPEGQPDVHWTCLFDEDDTCYYIYDSYEPRIKKVRKDMNFGFAKRYHLAVKVATQEVNVYKDLFARLAAALKDFLSFLNKKPPVGHDVMNIIEHK